MISFHLHDTHPLAMTSIHTVMRNMVLALHAEGYKVTWQSCLPLTSADMPSFRGRLEHLYGLPEGDHVRLTWSAGPRTAGLEEDDGSLAWYLWDAADSWRPYQERYIPAYHRMPAADRVVLFSDSCQQRFEAQGLDPGRIVRLPLGIDPVLFRPDGPARWPAISWQGRHRVRRGVDTFQPPVDMALTHNFLTAGYLQARKGIAETIEAYCQAFAGRDDVTLILKQVKRNWGEDQRRTVRKILDRYPDHPPLGICNEVLSPYQWAAMLRAADTVVNAHLIEGFALIPLEAMACGTGVIITNYGGPQEYADESNALLLEPTGEQYEILGGRSNKPATCPVAAYEIDDLAALMVEALDYEPRAGISSEVRQQWDWRHAARRLAEQVTATLGPVARRETGQPPRRTTPRLTACIPCKDGEALVRRCVATLIEQTAEPVRVLIYDDYSREPIGPVPGAEVIRAEKWGGEAVARRELARLADTEWVLTLDADIKFGGGMPPDWIERLIRHYHEHDACAVAGKQVNPRTGLIDACGGIIDHRFMRPGAHLYHGLPPTVPVVNRPQEVPYLPTSFLLARREDLLLAPHSTEYFPIWFMDVDLCYHLRAATGRGCWYCPSVEVWHDAHSWTGTNGQREAFQKNYGIFLSRWEDLLDEDCRRWLPGRDISKRQRPQIRGGAVSGRDESGRLIRPTGLRRVPPAGK